MSSMVPLIDAPIVAEDAASTSTSFAPAPTALVLINEDIVPHLQGQTFTAEQHPVVVAHHEELLDVLERELRRRRYGSVHLIGHGSPGVQEMGRTPLCAATLRPQHPRWQRAAASLLQHCSLYLYGCRVAAGREGHQLLQQLRSLFSASVVGSLHRVGPPAYGLIPAISTDHELETGSLYLDALSVSLHTDSVGFNVTNQSGYLTLYFFYGTWDAHLNAELDNPEGALALYTLDSGGSVDSYSDYNQKAYGVGGSISDYIYEFDVSPTVGAITVGSINLSEERNNTQYTDALIDSAGFTRGSDYYYAHGSTLAATNDGGRTISSHQWVEIGGIQPGTYRAYYDLPTPSGVTGHTALWEPNSAIQQMIFTVTSTGNIVLGSATSVDVTGSEDQPIDFSHTDFSAQFSGTLGKIKITSLPANGELRYWQDSPSVSASTITAVPTVKQWYSESDRVHLNKAALEASYSFDELTVYNSDGAGGWTQVGSKSAAELYDASGNLISTAVFSLGTFDWSKDLKIVTQLTDLSSGLEHESISYLNGGDSIGNATTPVTSSESYSQMILTDSNLGAGVDLSPTEQDELIYMPDADVAGTDGFKWLGEDTYNGVNTFSTTEAFVNIAIANVNDAPTSIALSQPTASLVEDGVAGAGTSSSVVNLTITDPDVGDTFQLLPAWDQGAPDVSSPTAGYDKSYFSISADGSVMSLNGNGPSVLIYERDITSPGSSWQLRQTINGFGTSELSGDGNYLVVGNANTDSAAIFKLDGSNQFQSEQTINVPGGYTGRNLAIDYDGDTVVISHTNTDSPSFNSGSFRLWSRVGSTWTQSFDAIGTQQEEYFGDPQLSADGKSLAVAGFGYDSSGVLNTGIIRLYYQDSNGDWHLNGTFTGDAANDAMRGMSFSDDGRTVAIGADGNSGGYVKVFTQSAAGSTWTQVGSTITGATDDRIGMSPSLSGDGNTLAVSAYGHNSGQGQAKIYDFNSSTSAWDLVDTLDGLGSGNNLRLSGGGGFGAVKLTPDATTLLLSNPGTEDKIQTFDLSWEFDSTTNTYRKAGIYGYASIDAAISQITYTLDNSLAATQALTEGQVVSENFGKLEVVDAAGASALSADVSFSITGANDGLVIDGTLTAGKRELSHVENNSTILTLTATDPDAGSTHTWSLSGADASNFTINSSTGELAFGSAPDFENPVDSDQDNIYEFTAIAADTTGSGVTDTQDIKITVQDDRIIATTSAAGVATNDSDSSSITSPYTLPSGIEDLSLSGGDNFDVDGNSLDNNIIGNSGDNELTGASGSDTLIGNSGHDTLDGGQGADSMLGGAGDDHYVVDNALDHTVESLNTVDPSLVSQPTGAYIQRGNSLYVVVDGPSWSTAQTNAQALGGDLVTINDAAENTWLHETFNIGDNNNMYWTGYSDDGSEGTWYWVSGETSTYTNWEANQPNNANISATYGENYMNLGLFGSSSDEWNDFPDVLVSGESYYADWLHHKGIAEIPIDSADQDLLAAINGLDLVESSVSITLDDFIEQLELTGVDNISGIGNSASNILTGNSGDNQLVGLAGDDTLHGGAGADSLLGGSDSDLLIGGMGADTLKGEAGADSLSGDGGNDVMAGSTSAETSSFDTLAGGAGDDTYHLENANDTLIEAASNGYDVVLSSTSYSLTDHFEELQLTGSADLNATGNADDNTLIGNSGANSLVGAGGDDTLIGNAGNDTLVGGSGADSILGEAGNDVLYGSAGDLIAENQAFNEAVAAGGYDEVGIITINGNTAGDNLGFAVSGAGDFNDDGVDDLIITAKNAGTSGEVYIVYGNQLVDDYNLSALEALTIQGLAKIDAWDDVSSLGDVNGDGIDDIIIAEMSANGNDGAAHVIFGSDSLTANVIDVTSLDGTNGFTINGDHGWLGTGVSSAGDFNNDGINDILVGVYGDPEDNKGRAYVIYGHDSIGGSGDLNIASIHGDSTKGLSIHGVWYSQYWDKIGSLGDINDDGFDDVGVASTHISSFQGAAAVIYGFDSQLQGAAHSINIRDIWEYSSGYNSHGFTIDGLSLGDQLGSEISGIGDLNNDGISDFAIAARFADVTTDDNAGEVYVIYGGANLGASGFSLSSLFGTSQQNGFVVQGASGSRLGDDIVHAGDLNGDNIDDLLISSDYDDSVYVIYGSTTRTGSVINLGSLGAADGMQISANVSHHKTLGAADLNNDGVGDILIGDTSAYSAAGQVSIYYGSGGQSAEPSIFDTLSGGADDDTYHLENANDTLIESASNGYDVVLSSTSYSLTEHFEELQLTGSADLNATGNADANTLIGNSAANSLLGAAGSDTLIGNAGNDTLDGGVGADSLLGGSGNDLYQVDDAGDVVIEAGPTSSVDLAVDSSGWSVNTGSIGTYTLTGAEGGGEVILGRFNDQTLSKTFSHDGSATKLVFDLYILDTWHDDWAGQNSHDPDEFILTLNGTTLIDHVFQYTLPANYVAPLTGTAGGYNWTMSTVQSKVALNTLHSGNDYQFRVEIDIPAGETSLALEIKDTLNEDVNNESWGLGDFAIGEQAGEDTVVSSIDYTLPTNVENLTLDSSNVSSPQGLQGSGNVLDNIIIGTSADDTLIGGSGFDSLVGEGGADSLLGGSDSDSLLGGAGNDTLYGEAGSDSLSGDAGADSLLGGADSDSLLGGAGNDTLRGEAGSDSLSGDAGQDVLYGSSSSETSSFDTLSGGADDDTYHLENANDTLIEAANNGYDLVLSSTSYSLTDHFEELQLTGSADLNATGNSAANTLVGNSGANYLSGDADTVSGGADTLIGNGGNDTLDGGLGVDSLVGGDGDDTYVVDSVNDVVDEQGSDSNDELITSNLSLDLQDSGFDGIENVVLDGSGNLNIIGDEISNTLTGNVGDNSIAGLAGSDTLFGSDGADTLDGGSAADTMYGGLGDDVYYVDHIDDSTVESVFAVDSSSASSGTPAIGEQRSYNGSIYQVIQAGSVAAHIQVAADLGGHLVTINDAAENQWLKDTFAGSYNGALIGLHWNGTSGRDPVANWSWYSGENSDYRNWNSGEPNGYSGERNVQLYSSGKWNDISSNSRSIVEINLGALASQTGHDVVFSSLQTHVLPEAIEDLYLSSTAGVNATGNLANNLIEITSGSASDTLDGGAGSDTLKGGLGDDVYYVDNVTDYVPDTGGDDHIISTSSLNLSDTITGGSQRFADIETLTLASGAGAINATGDADPNLLVGNESNNQLDGGAGADTMQGGDGSDIYSVDSVDDRVIEAIGEGSADIIYSIVSIDLDTQSPSPAGATEQHLEKVVLNNVLDSSGNAIAGLSVTGNQFDDDLHGNTGDNTLTGQAGDDALYGHAGADTLLGGDGDDVLQGGAGADSILGGADDDHLFGSAAAESIDFDTLEGGVGDDDYTVYNTSDTIVEEVSEGDDTILSHVTYSLANLPNVENIELQGTDNISATGHSGDNFLKGNPGANTLDGAGGADTLEGGDGDDAYYIDYPNVTIIETASGGTADKVITTQTGIQLPDNIEELHLGGTDDLNATGGNTAEKIFGNSGNNIVDGGGGDDVVGGGAGEDSLVGGLGHDTLKGQAGIDTLAGGDGDDHYVIEASDDVFDLLIEDESNGHDSIDAKISYQLPDNFEDLELTGSDPLSGWGNTLDNTIKGNSVGNILDGGIGDDTLDGGGGADDLIGGLGDDFYVVDHADDQTVERREQGHDTVKAYLNWTLDSGIEDLILADDASNLHLSATGNSEDNLLIGNTGNNTLTGAAGDDTMQGGSGDDIYVVNSSDDLVIEYASEGVDTVQSSANWILADHIEHLTLTSWARQATGNSLDNIISGTYMPNQIDGKGGIDTMSGGRGADTYFVDDSLDRVVELDGEGIDIVHASADYVLPDFVEKLYLDGTDDLKGTGNTLNNYLYGNDGDNSLDGGSGRDYLSGGLGDDIYVVDSSGDRLKERSNEGVDTVQSSIDWTLARNFERLELTGSAIEGEGNSDPNTIIGNDQNNILDGGKGSDTLYGGLGDDLYRVNETSDVVLESVSIASTYDFESTQLNGWSSSADSGGSHHINTFTVGESGSAYGPFGSSGWLDFDLAENASGSTISFDFYIFDSWDGESFIVKSGSTNVFSMSFSHDVFVQSQNGSVSGYNWHLENYDTSARNQYRMTGTATNYWYDQKFKLSITFPSGVSAYDLRFTSTLDQGASDEAWAIDNFSIPNLSSPADGNDTIESSVSWDLTANTDIENLTLSGFSSIDATGNTLDNILTGNSGNNRLEGGDGIDTLIGGRGHDTYVLSSADGSDLLVEELYGGTDTVEADLSFTLPSNFEHLKLTGSASITATGNAANNDLTGNAGDNTLDGAAGRDEMVGMAGADVYYVDNDRDKVIESVSTVAGEIDEIRSTVSYELPEHVEALTLLGGDNLSAEGNDDDNILTGNTGNNLIEGLAGADSLLGLGGDDVILAGDGADTVLAGADDDWIDAGSGHDSILGEAGADSLSGGLGDDTLDGGAGDDRLAGGAGADVAIGGSGDDIYYVDNANDVVVEDVYMQPIVVASDFNTFDSGSSFAGWSLNSTAIASSNLDASDSNLGSILGRFGYNASGDYTTSDGYSSDLLSKTLQLDSKASQVEFTLYFFDSWDGRNHLGSSERFYIRDSITNTVIFNRMISNIFTSGVDKIFDVAETGSEVVGGQTIHWTVEPLQAASDFAFGSHLDQKLKVTLDIPAGLSSLGLDLYASVFDDASLSDPAVETWAIDDFTVREIGYSPDSSHFGQDTIVSSVSFDLSDSPNVEALQIDPSASGSFALGGNTLANRLDGGDGDDTLTGALGLDTLAGGDGDDVYYADSQDLIVELADAGYDTVISDISFTLPANTDHLQLELNVDPGPFVSLFSSDAGIYARYSDSSGAVIGTSDVEIALASSSSLPDQPADVSTTSEVFVDGYAVDASGNPTGSYQGASYGDIDSSGDVDYWKVELTAGTAYTFSLVTPSTSTLDTWLRLYSYDGSTATSVAYNDDNGSLPPNADGNSYNSLIDYTPTVSGTYYLSASAYPGDGGGTSTGPYTLAASSSGYVAHPARIAGTPLDAVVTSLANGQFAVSWVVRSGSSGSYDYDVQVQLFSAAGQAESNPITVNSGSDSATAPSIQQLANGNIIVSWTSGDSIKAKQLDSNLATVSGSDLTISHLVSGSSVAHASNSSLVPLATGEFVIVWQADQSLDGSDEGIYLQRFASDSSPLGSQIAVNSSTQGSQSQPQIAALSDGGFLVVWMTSSADGPSDSLGTIDFAAIVAQRFDVSGAAVGLEHRVNQFTTGNQSDPVIAALPNGGWVVAWQSATHLDSTDPTVVARVYHADGSSGDEFVVNQTLSGYQGQPFISSLNDGGFLITWTSDSANGTDAFARRYDLNGSPVTDEYTLNAALTGDQIALGSALRAVSAPSGLFGTGNALANLIEGTSQGDTLDGAAGVDSLVGGAGDDVYYVDNTDDAILELASGGSADQVVSTVDYELPNHVEQLTLQGTASADLSGVGNDLANTITGDAGDNIVSGYAGADSLLGLAGDDQLLGGAGVDSLLGGADDDLLSGGEGADVLHGGTEHDALYGGAGADSLYGDDGNDALYGDADDDLLDGGSGNDTLHGGEGTDTLKGGVGDDSYVIDDLLDIVDETGASGTDEVVSSFSADLSSSRFTGVENLTLASGAGDLSATGDAAANILRGNEGDNILTGNGGVDTLIGGDGDDHYVISSTSSTIVEMSDDGEDSVLASTPSYTLPQHVEDLAFSGPTGTINIVSQSLSWAADYNEHPNHYVRIGLTSQGGVVVFGSDASRGANISSVSHLLESDVVQIYSHYYGFAALKSDGQVVTWGTYSDGVRDYPSQNRSVDSIVSSGTAFVALLDDGSLDAWGNAAAGGSLPSELVGVTGIQKVVSIGWGFAALLGNGEVVSWGSVPYASDPASNPDFTPGTTKVVDLISSGYSFAALRDDGTVVHWAGYVFNNDTSANAHNLANSFDWNGPNNDLSATAIYPNSYGIAVVRSDSSIVSFGRESGAGLIAIDNTGLTIDRIVGGARSFAALRSDGSVIAWGTDMPDDVISLDVGNPAVRSPVDLVFSGDEYKNAYGVLFDDGTVQTFGNQAAGGGSLSALNLNGSDGSLTVVSLLGGANQFSALRSDGSVVSWGDSAPSESTPSVLASGVSQLISSNVALMEDGSFVTFNSSSVDHHTSSVPLIGLNNYLTDDRFGLSGVIATGNSLSNAIVGTTESDTLDGAAGADSLVGGDGSDLYKVDHLDDDVLELAGGGSSDHIEASVDFTLPSEVEVLTLVGSSTDDLSGVGNELANTIVGDVGDNELFGLAGNDLLKGMAGSDQLFGGDGNDTLEGGEANDTLTGGLGSDSLIGGSGDDTYIIDDANDVIHEFSGGGNDHVIANTGLDFSSGQFSNVESFTLTEAAGDAALTGDASGNWLVGNSGDNTLAGGAGADILIGGEGDDTYEVDSLSDQLTELADEGADTVVSSLNFTLAANFENLTLSPATAGVGLYGTGNTATNYIVGSSGNDTLDGASGVDHLSGGDGDDLYLVDHSSDLVVELAGEGSADTVKSTASYTLSEHIENLVLNGSASDDLRGIGNSSDNSISGDAGDNEINGGAGVDTMTGGLGDDYYHVDDAGDLVVELASGGDDTIKSSVSYVLPTTAEIENLILSGSLDLNATGNGLDNLILGNFGDNLIDGGAGADTMRGFAGDDIYIVDNTGDVIVDTTGSDVVKSSVTYAIPNGIEDLLLTGGASVDGTGNYLGNVITGNTGDNVLDGGRARDYLTGGLGADTFLFTERQTGRFSDHITDFDAVHGDKIKVDLAAFGMDDTLVTLSSVNTRFQLSRALRTDDLFVYDQSTGYLYINENGSSYGYGSGGVIAVLQNQHALLPGDLQIQGSREDQILNLCCGGQNIRN